MNPMDRPRSVTPIVTEVTDRGNIAPVNQVGQSFVLTLSCLVAVDVNIRTANPGLGGDTLTLAAVSSHSQITFDSDSSH